MHDKAKNPRSRRNILAGRDAELIKAIEDNRGNISATAKAFDVAENAIYRWMERNGVSIEITARVITEAQS